MIYEIDFHRPAFKSVNDAMCQFLGYTREELLAMNPFDFLDDEGKAVFRERIRRKLAGEVISDSVEYKSKTKDGREVYGVLNITFTYKDGKPERAVVVAHDITERRLAEEAMRTHRQLLETVVNHLPAAVNVIRGSDLRIALVNPAYQAIAPGKEMVGKTLDELWPETQRTFVDLCRQVLATGEPYHAVDEMIMICRYPGGPVEQAYFSWSLFRVRLPGDEGWAILNTAWETTERKRVEEELRGSCSALG